MWQGPGRSRSLLSRIAEAGMIGLTHGVFALARRLGPERSADIGAALARRFGPPAAGASHGACQHPRRLPREGRGRSAAQSRLRAWDNLGRTGAEYPHLGALFDYEYGSDKTGRVEVDGIEHFIALRDDGRPGLIFSAHLANWELPAICAARYGLDATAVFRAPNDPAVARVVHEVRSETMGGLEAARQGAAFAMQGVLEKRRPSRHADRPAFHARRHGRFHGPPGAASTRSSASSPAGSIARSMACASSACPATASGFSSRRPSQCRATGWRDRRAGRDADDDVGRRGLGAGVSGAMAVDASALARPAPRSSSRQSEFPLRTLSYSMLGHDLVHQSFSCGTGVPRRWLFRSFGALAGRRRAVHEPGLLVLSAGRCVYGGAGTPYGRDRADFPCRLLGLSRLEGHARPAVLFGQAAGLCPCETGSAGLSPRKWS